jgi:hypothetical protein
VIFAPVFILLYVAHLLADYPLQTDRQASRKAGWVEGEQDPNPGCPHHGWGANLAHAGTHILTTAAALGIGAVVLDLPLSWPAAVIALLWIGATHSIIDRRWPIQWCMQNTRQPKFAEHGGAAHVDQTAHITALVIAALGIAAT